MAGINRVVLVGTIDAEPVRAGGVTEAVLAVTRQVKGDEWAEHVERFTVEVPGKQGDALTEGALVGITGRMAEGEPTVIAERVEFVAGADAIEQAARQARIVAESARKVAAEMREA